MSAPRAKGEQESMWAAAAWSYFEKNAAPATGLTPARAGAPYASAWSIADQIAALVAARRLELVDPLDFDKRFSAILGFLVRMPLAYGELPNRIYNVETGDMVGADFQSGIAGWSAVDTGRLLIWLRIAATEYPFYQRYIRNVIARLSVCRIMDDAGRLFSAQLGAEGPTRLPETSRGYDRYAVQGYRAWGLAVPVPDYAPSPFEADFFGNRLPVYDTPELSGPIATAPPSYVGLEFGFELLDTDAETTSGAADRERLETLYAIQHARWRETGIQTARAEYRRSTEPFVVLDSVLAAGYPWSTTDQSGRALPGLALVSTRAAFALASFFDTNYRDTLFEVIGPLYDEERGWGEGRYESSGAYEETRTSSTNAFVLESIAYLKFGYLFPAEAWPDNLAPPIITARNACRLPGILSDTDMRSVESN